MKGVVVCVLATTIVDAVKPQQFLGRARTTSEQVESIAADESSLFADLEQRLSMHKEEDTAQAGLHGSTTPSNAAQSKTSRPASIETSGSEFIEAPWSTTSPDQDFHEMVREFEKAWHDKAGV